MFSLNLLPLLDSAFPTGAFSHSFGMETAIQENKVRHPAELADWLTAYIKGNVVPMEGAGVYWAYQWVSQCMEEVPDSHRQRQTIHHSSSAASEKARHISLTWSQSVHHPGATFSEMHQPSLTVAKSVHQSSSMSERHPNSILAGAHGTGTMLPETVHRRSLTVSELIAVLLQDLDQRLTVSRLARESREGGIKMGRRYLRLLTELYPEAGLAKYERWIREEKCYGNSAVVHGWICAYLKQGVASAVLSYLYVSTNNLIQNAIRAMSLGHTMGQKLLHQMLPLLEKEAEDLIQKPPSFEQLASGAPVQEIQAMRHERLYSRIFMS